MDPDLDEYVHVYLEPVEEFHEDLDFDLNEYEHAHLFGDLYPDV